MRSATLSPENKTFVDQMFMAQCRALAKESHCAGADVAALIVQRGQVVSTGVNSPVLGSCKERSHCYDSMSSCKEGELPSLSVHAETVAISNCNRDLHGAEIYVTHEPCFTCLKLIIFAGIDRIVYGESLGTWSKGKAHLIRTSGVTLTYLPESDFP